MNIASPTKLTRDLKVEKLPSLPHVLVSMLDACHHNTASFQQISQIVSQDAAIAARVLSLANSSFYKRGAEVNSIERALLVLGTDTIKTIVITASIQQFFSSFNIRHIDFLKQFWRQSLACAHLAKALAILTSYPKPEEAYLTGILHNIGELVLSSTYNEQFIEFSSVQKDGLDRLAKEADRFGIHHADIGAILAKEWRLGNLVSEAIEFHHSEPENITDAQHLVKLIYLSSHVAVKLTSQSGSEDELKSYINQLDLGYALFELNQGLLFEIASKVQNDINEISDSLDISLGEVDKDQSAQVKLAKYVRNIGLVQTVNTHINQAQSLDGLNKAFATTVELLFGYANSLLFWYTPEEGSLSYVKENADELSTRYTIKLEKARSIITDSALDNTIQSSLSNTQANNDHSTKQTVIDEQLCRLLKSPGLLCVPIQSNSKLFGVLVLGCEESIEADSNLYRLLSYFAKEVSHICHKTLCNIQEGHTPDSESLQQKAQEIAHEANNPLNIINNYLLSLSTKIESMSSAHADFDSVKEELAILREEVSRTSDIISRLRDLKKEAVQAQGEVDINAEIEDLCTLYKHSLFLVKNLHCELTLDPSLPVIAGNKNQFKQILTNLIKNAAEALPQDGTICISSAANIKMNGQDFVEVLVKDDGPGIPKQILDNLFSPVQSTKGGKHSGLGLSITKNLVTDAKGTISCRSNEKGTSFQVFLPQQAIETLAG